VAIFGFEIPFPVIMLGTIIGLTYGILAVGLVLVYRTNRIINFAHGEIGAFGAAIFGLITTRYNVYYYLAFPLAIALSASVGALAEIGVVRRLRKAPRLMSIVATLGVGQFLLLFSLAANSQAQAGNLYPQPLYLPEFQIGALRVTQAYTGMLFFTPLVVLGLVLFLRYSRFGLAIRGAAANAELARMSGIFASRMSSAAWAIAGGISAFTAILFSPARGFVSGESFGPGLLLRALVAAVIGRMTNLPIALAAGVGVGVVEQLLLWNYPRGGLVEAALFVIILATLLFQRKIGGREDEKGSWAAVQAWRPLPEAYRQLPLIRALPWLFGGGILALALLLLFVMTNSAAIILVGIIAFAIVGLSVGVVTGLSGQLSLGQFALAGIGATVSYYVSSRTGNFFLSFLYAGLGAAGASLIIGLPALRIRGLLLTVTTLSFALVTPAWLLQQPWMLGEGLDPGRPILASTPLTSGKSYYVLALAVLVVASFLARNIRRSGIGRRLIAIRDNEDNARAFTVPAALVKLQAFMLAGFLAGLGGAVYGHALSRIGVSAFPASASINVVAMTVIGGIGILAGPILGALYIIGIPEFVPLDSAGLAATSLGWLILILYAPGGVAQLVQPLRDRFVDRVARRAGLDVEALRADETAQPASTMAVTARVEAQASSNGHVRAAAVTRPAGTTLLRAENLRRYFGGVKAVDGVSFSVRAGETLGLIGPNGAGKTTLFELLGGFTRPDSGRVIFDGQDISGLGPEERAQLGLIRSFQDAALFPTMTVLDAVRLSLEKTQPTPFFSSLIGVSRFERDKDRRARELVALLGLERYRNKQIQELSTGTRRITELACLVALEPALLLLDEPSSGIAQRETEALGALLQDLKDQLDATLIVIEHDIPLIMSLSDHILAMDTGKVIAYGDPQTVRNNPRVVEAYLGGSLTAIERSGATAPVAAGVASGGNGDGSSGNGAGGGTAVLAPPAPAPPAEFPRVAGVGPAKEAALLATFGSVEGLRRASVDELAAVRGVGVNLAERLYQRLHGPAHAGR
jgi:ABC-type branched-subunit amino acid transport system ATPase component/ABC-type branched-subunit amino acid transport system permease subunit